MFRNNLCFDMAHLINILLYTAAIYQVHLHLIIIVRVIYNGFTADLQSTSGLITVLYSDYSNTSCIIYQKSFLNHKNYKMTSNKNVTSNKSQYGGWL